jgi:aquaporin Z
VYGRWDMESTRLDRPDAAQQPVIQGQPAPDFFDTSFEWRRVFAETWGTFLLVLVAAGGGVVAAMSDSRVTLGMMAVAPGLMAMVIIYFMGAVSGARLNPAVTLAFAVRRDFPWQRVPGYIFGQLIGGIGAAAFLRAMFGTVGALGATLPGHGVTGGKALAMEVVLTAGLVHTILGTASGARNVGSNGALAVGGYIALAGLWAAPITGSSMNPGAFAGAGCGARRVPHHLDLPRSASDWGLDRSGLRVDSQGEAYSGRQARRAGHAPCRRSVRVGYLIATKPLLHAVCP